MAAEDADQGGLRLMGAETYHERLAFAVVGAVLGVTVEHYDCKGRQNAVDAILHYPDGTTAALEVSSISPIEEGRIQHYLGIRGNSKSITGLAGKWLVELPFSFHPSNMRKVEEALLRCETHRASHLADLVDNEPDTDLLRRQGVRADLIDAIGSLAYFVLPPIGGASAHGLDPLPNEVAATLSTPLMESKLSKLKASGQDERHLFLVVLPTAFSYPVFDGLSWGGQLPKATPSFPEGLSQLWLLTGVQAGGVVRGISGREWRRDQPYDNLDLEKIRQP